ncbi:hypothetical protein EUX98_g2968 [Antrodiella citrinella]|uniref:Protein kinase domain-containing protein n=1 Tax=Antrodiella citrinella TaxID=2447956 RepID=A0A4S4MXP9_9APHY|nr:hypothetical protein EUX98_g2968 [Antrodiella citrinella]
MNVYSLRTPAGVQRIIQAALNRADEGEATDFSTTEDAQIVLDELWKVLDSPALPNAVSGGSQFFIYRNKLRKLSLKMAVKHDILPTALILRGVQLIDNTQHGTGGFADVYCGIYGGFKVALKRLRVYVASSDKQKQALKKAFYRESILWKNLVHDHIVPFLGVSEDVFDGTICMVLPWQESGSLRHYLDKMRDGMSDEEFVLAVDKWLYQTALGLEYLHDEGIVHGDLHAGNILVDEDNNACLTDFGMSLITEATAYNYASIHGGGALRWQAPELIDPDEFGLESSRPTPQSDIFSFACTAIELYSGKPPCPELTDRQVTNRYIKGKRPPRSSLPNGGDMSDAIWSLLEACWAHNRADRLSSREVVIRLGTLVRGVPPMVQLVEKMAAVAVQDAKHKAATSQDPEPPAAASSAPPSTDDDDMPPWMAEDPYLDIDPEVLKPIFEPLKDLKDQESFSDDDLKKIMAMVFEVIHIISSLWRNLEDDKFHDAVTDATVQSILVKVSVFIIERMADDSDNVGADSSSLLDRALVLPGEGDVETRIIVLLMMGEKCKNTMYWVAVDDGFRCLCGEDHLVPLKEVKEAVDEMHSEPEKAAVFRDAWTLGVTVLVHLKRMHLLKKQIRDYWGVPKTDSSRRVMLEYIKQAAQITLDILRLPDTFPQSIMTTLFDNPNSDKESYEKFKTEFLHPIIRVLSTWIELSDRVVTAE